MAVINHSNGKKISFLSLNDILTVSWTRWCVVAVTVTRVRTYNNGKNLVSDNLSVSGGNTENGKRKTVIQHSKENRCKKKTYIYKSTMEINFQYMSTEKNFCIDVLEILFIVQKGMENNVGIKIYIARQNHCLYK